MHIITGKARGKRLLSVPGEQTRPTTQMAKEGIFSAIQFELLGASVLDLFSGTGQLALEALSRGASSAVLVESARRAVEVIRQNVQSAGFSAEAQVRAEDVFAFLKHTDAKFDFIFADPPYETGLAPKVVEKVLEYDLLRPRGALILESDAEDSVPAKLRGAFASERSYRYGKTHFILLRKGEQ